MQIKRMMFGLFTALTLCTGVNQAAFAETPSSFVDSGISLMYEIANDPIVDLEIFGDTAYCTSSASGDNAQSITVTQTLQKHWGLWIWTNVDGAEWSKTVNRSSISLSNSKSGLANGTYRVKSVFTLTNKNGKSETVTIYSNEVDVP